MKCQIKDPRKLVGVPFLDIQVSRAQVFSPGIKILKPDPLARARDNCRKNPAGICGEQFGTLSPPGNENSYEEFSGRLAGRINLHITIRGGAICIPGTEYLQCQRLPSRGDDVPTIP